MSFCLSLYKKLVKAISHKTNPIGNGMKLNSNITSKERPSPPKTKAERKEKLVPYHPDVIKTQVNPINIKFLSWFLKYFKAIVIPKIIDTITNDNPSDPLRISKGVSTIIFFSFLNVNIILVFNIFKFKNMLVKSMLI